MAKESPTAKRSRGEIETLPSGSLRVKVYAGIDPISKTRMYLRETIPAGPTAEREAEKVLARFRREVYERRHPRTDATVQQLIDRHLADAKLGIKTRKNYRSQAEKHIIPCIGQQKVRAVDADISDSFYAELRRCRDHCDGHRSPHSPDARLRRPMQAARLQAAERVEHPLHTSDPQRSLSQGCSFEVGVCQPVRLRRAAAGTKTEASASLAERGREHRHGGVEGPRLGHADLAHDGDGESAGRAVRNPVAPRLPAEFSWDLRRSPPRVASWRPAPKQPEPALVTNCGTTRTR